MRYVGLVATVLLYLVCITAISHIVTGSHRRRKRADRSWIIGHGKYHV